ncbi:hypothetical protein GCM10027271_42840 [Saccharopolyspora gloriosae]|uniref:DNA-binding CsgD family transcriptional regulator n=1 Tax=Saccharopolyspora gloriosae TaxID=455344 RepID=A0A840NES0_9PSEU|nr:helix-turn-helix transcriptional regulator [Saccharopolyspora gloriosae]MBB5070420.1 DNA-binding CsgD family transcriptional regulator [Saccharopolyspora gloriosae]
MIDLYPNRIATLRLRAELSATELEVARLVACNLPNMDIATSLCRSEDTIKNRLVRLFRATGASTRPQFVVWMYETGHVLPGLPRLPEAPLRPRHRTSTPLTAEEAAALSLPALRHQLAATRTELDTLVTFVDPHRERT